MDKLLNSITQKCLQSGLIDEGQTEWLLYSLQCRVMNIGGFLRFDRLGVAGCTVSSSSAFEPWTCFLAQRTNGLHMPTKLSCFAFSLFCEYACLFAIRQMASNRSLFSLGLLLVSSALIVWLAPCNNKAIHLSQDELQKARKGVHIRLAVYLLVIFILFVQMPLLANTLVVAETAVALLVALAHLGVGIQ